jgi:hypothetical protein
MKAMLSVLALYNYDNTIFDNLEIPQGVAKEDVINNILMELAEVEILYANPAMMKSAIGFWSKKELPVWTKLYATTQQEYNPIYNQFRTEEWTDTETRNLTGSNNQTRDLSGSDTQTRELTIDSKQNGTDTKKEYVSGFNESTPTLKSQEEHTPESGNIVQDTGTVGNATTDTGTVNNTISDSGTITHQHDAKFDGHTGIVPVQTLIKMERETVQFNICDYIIASFKRRFCILVY